MRKEEQLIEKAENEYETLLINSSFWIKEKLLIKHMKLSLNRYFSIDSM